MSWWESASGFTNLASVALKTAQKRIDKVLDIQEEDEDGSGTPSMASYTPSSPAKSPVKTSDDENFFDSWLGNASSQLSNIGQDKIPKTAAAESPASAKTELSLKEKLEKKREARAAQKSAVSASKTSTTSPASRLSHSPSPPKTIDDTAAGVTTETRDLSNESRPAEVKIGSNISQFTTAEDKIPEKPAEENAIEKQFSSLDASDPDRGKAPTSLSIDDALGSHPQSAFTSVKKDPDAYETQQDPRESPSMVMNSKEQCIVGDGESASAEPESCVDVLQHREKSGGDTEAGNDESTPHALDEDITPVCDEGTVTDRSHVELSDMKYEQEMPVDPDVTDLDTCSGDAGELDKDEPVLTCQSAGVSLAADHVQQSDSPDISSNPASESNASINIEPPVESDSQMDVPFTQTEAENRDIGNSSLSLSDGSTLAQSGVGGWDDVSLSIISVASQPEVTEDASVIVPQHEDTVCEASSSVDAASTSAILTESNSSWDTAGDVLPGGDAQAEAHAITDKLDDSQSVKEVCDKNTAVVPATPDSQESQLVSSDVTDSSLLSVVHLNDFSSGKELEESSETIDELSDSNRTLTREDIELARKEADLEVMSDDDKGHGELHEGQCEQCENDVQPETETGEACDSGEKSDDVAPSHLSSSSYVKNMLEEAMVESVKDTDSHSSSEMVRIESGHTSGHTSADEIDTTTSSDIEIISHISTPTPNGDGQKVDRPFDLSPLRHAFRSVRRSSPPGHKRSDSSSSGLSAHSRSWDDALSPDASHVRRDSDQVERLQSVEQDNPAESSNPLETEKLLKNLDNRELAKKLAEVSEILDAREKKLVVLSQENIDLAETNSVLRTQLQQAEEAREAEMEDLNALSEEFMQRIAEAEKKNQTVLREKETVKKKLQEAEAELLKRADKTVTDKQLKEKEQIIQELMEEGQKLSKQQLQSSNIIKKLRAKEKETETTIKSQSKKMEEQTTEIEDLKKILDSKVEMEKSQAEAINQLNAAVKKQETDILRLTSDLEDAEEKSRSMKVALDNSYKEMADLHKAKATTASEAQQASLQAEIRAKEEVRLAMEEYQHQARHQQQALLSQIEDLHLSMARMEKEHGRREDSLRQEISDLHQRLQEAEERNQELSSNVTAATRPLLRQIENLQATYTSQSASYEKVERNLTERLAEAQNQLAAAVEKERSGSEKVMEATARLSSLESQLSMLRQEKSRLQAHLEMEKNKVQILEETKSSDSAQMEGVRLIMEREIADLKKEKVVLENQLEMERMKVDSERKKVMTAQEQIREKELALQNLKPSITPPGRHSREGSVASVDTPMNMSMQSLSSPMVMSQSEETLEKSLWHAAAANGNKLSLYESLRQSNAASLIDQLQSQLKQKEGEITQLQGEIGELERTRESLARELVNITTERDTLDSRVTSLTVVQKQYQDLDGRYQALLQMYGEKEEQAQELQLDLQDMKELYKAQINELLKSK